MARITSTTTTGTGKRPLETILREKLLATGMTYYQLQQVTGVVQSVLYRFGRGIQSVNLDTAQKLIDYFKIEIVEPR